MTLLGTTEEVAADVVAKWDELSRVPLGYVGPEPRRQRDAAADRDRDVLDEIPPADYVEALTGVEVPHHGVICCPLPGHDDRSPSFKVWPDAGWFCFGCGRGGDLYTLGAELWGMSTRGPGFRELRRELARALLKAAA